MRQRVWISSLILVLGTVAAPCDGISQAHAPAASESTHIQATKTQAAAGPLKITFGDKSEDWTPATLAPLPHMIVSVYNEHAKADQSYSGVLLSTLLTRLGVSEKPHGKDFQLYVLAEGADGYQVVYSIGEVTPDIHDGNVIVADAMGGKPLADSGPLQLVATGEKRPARWVRNLVAVRVLPAQ